MKIKNLLLSFTLLTLFACGGGSKNQPHLDTFEEEKIEETAETIAVRDYLNSQTVMELKKLTYGDFNKVFDADIIVAEKLHPYKDHDGVSSSVSVKHAYFIKRGSELSLFRDLDELLFSQELVSTIKNGVGLKNQQDAIAIYKALNVLDPRGANDNYGYIHDGNTWFFIRSKFFEKYSGYIFTTDGNGSIQSIAEHSVNDPDLDKVIVPEINFKEESDIKLTISNVEKEQIVETLENSITARFIVREVSASLLNELGLKLFEYNNTNLVEEDGLSASFSMGGMFVLEFNGVMQHYSNAREVVCSKLLVQALQNNKAIISSDDAQAFQSIINEVSPIEDDSHKSFFEKDNKWHFVRGEYDNKVGFVVSTDNNGKVVDIKYSIEL